MTQSLSLLYNSKDSYRHTHANMQLPIYVCICTMYSTLAFWNPDSSSFSHEWKAYNLPSKNNKNLLYMAADQYFKKCLLGHTNMYVLYVYMHVCMHICMKDLLEASRNTWCVNYQAERICSHISIRWCTKMNNWCHLSTKLNTEVPQWTVTM